MKSRKRSFSKVPSIAKVAFIKTVDRVKPVKKSPDEAYQRLFADVREASLFVDGKIFADLVPRKSPTITSKKYEKAKKKADFDLKAFIDDHFYEFTSRSVTQDLVGVENMTTREYVRELWPHLERRNYTDKGSLIALPHPYIVPGGRFNEQFYWDTYFVMLGLAADGRWDDIYGMMRNYAYMMSKLRLIPTANRTYFVSRSQPPFLAFMVRLLSEEYGKNIYAEFLPVMLAEYRFWMRGTKKALAEGSFKRLVYMADGDTFLNRYFDNKPTPRPDVGGEDLHTASLTDRDSKKLFTDIRAGAESGWDFSSRWFEDARSMQSIVTTDIVPVDLNSLLFYLENTIAEAYDYIKLPKVAKRFRIIAERRATAVNKYMWNEKQGYYCDYNFIKHGQSAELTLAGVFPLYCKLATDEQAAKVADRIEKDFLRQGGLVTTLKDTGQQWDSPNGWAPLQWAAIQGLRNYGHDELAKKIRDAWLKANEMVFDKYHKMVEKYDVVNPGVIGAGGEYAPQEGFGWTNGVYAVLKDEQSFENK